MVDQVLADENLLEGDVFWSLADHLGTVRTLLDNEGDRIRDRVFAAWGAIVEDTNPTFVYPYAFTGREYDLETGFYYYRARYYDPATGRFLSEDPLGFAAGDTNLARYVLNSPTNYVDPTGLFWLLPPYPTYGPGDLFYKPLFDHYHTGYLNEDNVKLLPTEEDRKRWIEEAAEMGDFTTALLYMWTQEDMRAWFNAEQSYRKETLKAYREELNEAVKQLAKLVDEHGHYDEIVKYVNGWTRGRRPKLKETEFEGALNAFDDAMSKLSLLHREAHAWAIEEYNSRHPGGPQLKSVEYYYRQGPTAKPKSSELTFEDGSTVIFGQDKQGAPTDQSVGPQGIRRSSVEKIMRETFKLAPATVDKIMARRSGAASISTRSNRMTMSRSERCIIHGRGERCGV